MLSFVNATKIIKCLLCARSVLRTGSGIEIKDTVLAPKDVQLGRGDECINSQLQDRTYVS